MKTYFFPGNCCVYWGSAPKEVAEHHLLLGSNLFFFLLFLHDLFLFLSLNCSCLIPASLFVCLFCFSSISFFLPHPAENEECESGCKVYLSVLNHNKWSSWCLGTRDGELGWYGWQRTAVRQRKEQKRLFFFFFPLLLSICCRGWWP